MREVAHGGDEGPWIFELPGTLAAVLRDADDARITGFAREWAQTEEWVADGVPEEDLRDLLADVAHLANEAQPPKQLYLWMSL